MSDLVWAIKNGDLEKVQELVSAKVSDLGDTFKKNWTILILAFLRELVSMARPMEVELPPTLQLIMDSWTSSGFSSLKALTSMPKTSTESAFSWLPFGRVTPTVSSFC